MTKDTKPAETMPTASPAVPGEDPNAVRVVPPPPPERPMSTTAVLTGADTVNDVLPASIQVVATVVGAPAYGIDYLLGP